jgi:hypothetical protein
VNAKALQAAGNRYAVLLKGDAVLQSVAHIHLADYGHIVAGCFHDFLNAHRHEAYTILQTASIFIVPMIEVGIQELIDQIAVSAMDFYLVKPSLTGQVYRLAKLASQHWQFIGAQSAYDGWAIEVESRTGTNGNTPTDCLVAHIAAVSKLNTSSRTFAMYAIGKPPKARDDFRLHDKLTVKAKAAFCYGSVSHSCHAYSASGYSGVVIIEHLAGFMPRAHTFKCCAPDGSVSKRQRTDLGFLKDCVHIFYIVFYWHLIHYFLI